jgi:SPP1 family predicted phage head-tail adaptor
MTSRSPSIGARSRRFVLELPLERPDGFGGVIRSYAPGPQLWGAIEMLSGTERVRADRPEQSLTHRVTLRYREGVTGAMRLTCGLRRFVIRAASDPDGSKRDLVCLVEEVRP